MVDGLKGKMVAAASARLCVETRFPINVQYGDPGAAASARLCVETTLLNNSDL